MADVDAVLDELPPGYVVAGLSHHRLVAGPTGAFVVAPAGDADDHRADEAAALHHLAAATREALADHLSWVPFVDPLLVLAPGSEAVVAPGAAAMPLDLLRHVLVAHHGVVDDDTLHRLTDLVVCQRLAVAAVVPGPPVPGARMTRCDTSPRPTVWCWPSTTSAARVDRSCSPTPPASTGGCGSPSPGT
ncbi:hypothetical protein BH20ACT2_BH20ACT2_12230 [soil metagenome]